ncbi:s-adenosylmethionine-dependent methyltransferase [Vairimorpha apis BRL 01]|uniref:tRNA (guanine(46)-N(7))-methyltransferase n=1 Tax=Vairimorpha apis BRL 01 TaxID=1037528 RepID=T0LAU4_9MICR|nr:s-adenosylmethionine-dependent methyltransferase [Vairimorpha apis BRL 01]
MSEISKRDYRQRAHANPFKDVDVSIPLNPSRINWYDHFDNGKPPVFLDIGCGYGKFIMDLAKEHTKNVLGLEIRNKVTEYVKAKIKEKQLTNCAVIKTNALLFLVNFFEKNSLEKIFQKGRIICKQMISTLEYILNNNGRLYISTDVKSLYDDMVNTILNSKLFKKVEEEDKDLYYSLTYKNTDEAMRAGIKTGETFACIFEKI